MIDRPMHRAFIPSRLLAISVTAVGLSIGACLGGCATEYGGRRYPVEIETVPPGATVSVAKYATWLQQPEETRVDPTNRSIPWETHCCSAPALLKLPSVQWIAVAEWKVQGRRVIERSDPFTPMPGASPTSVKITMPAQPPGAGSER